MMIPIPLRPSPYRRPRLRCLRRRILFRGLDDFLELEQGGRVGEQVVLWEVKVV
jgi:hypothetical protein